MKQLISLLIFIPILVSCTGGEKTDNKLYQWLLDFLLSESVPAITIEEFKKISGDLYIIDVREAREFEVSRLEGAVYVRTDNENRPLSIPSEISKADRIVVYCSVGYRSEKAAEYLLEQGYEHTVNLYGGIFEWANRGYDLYNDSGRTDKIHAYGRFWGLWVTNVEKVYN